jgi:hypothetical protein
MKMKKRVGITQQAEIAEIRSAWSERRAPDGINRDVLADWTIAARALLHEGELDAVEHTLRHVHAAFPRLEFARNMCSIFDRVPTAGEQPPFHDDGDADVQIVERPGADTLILFFCGFTGQLGLPLPLVHRWLGKLPAHLVYLRDFQRQFYLRGVRSIGPRSSTLDELRRIADRLGARRVLCYGNSGGVFAAMHYGIALSADSVVCLAGSTNLTPEFNAHARRPDSRSYLVQDLGAGKIELDLRRSYETAARPPRTLLLFGADNWDDRIQAENLRNLPTVTLCAVPKAGNHNIIADLIRRGDFESVLAWLMQPGAELCLSVPPERQTPSSTAGFTLLRKLVARFVRPLTNGSPPLTSEPEPSGNQLQQQQNDGHSAGTSAGLRAGLGAPMRNRRSESDSAPPKNITTAPSQINSTSGL